MDLLAWVDKNRNWSAALAVAFCVLAFSVTRSPVFSILGFFAIIALLAVDFTRPSAPGDFKKSAIEFIQAVALAVVAWLALQVILQTGAPLDVVTSCSMLPVLQRGDLIVLQGGAIKAPVLNVSGPLESSQHLLSVRKSPCTVTVAGQSVRSLCTDSLIFNGTAYPLDKNNDIIVYNPQPREYGLIVHRAVATVSNGTDSFTLTKGDNNLGMDQEAGIAPVPPSDINGKVIFRVPLIGYLKLFLFLQFNEPAGCQQAITAGN